MHLRLLQPGEHLPRQRLDAHPTPVQGRLHKVCVGDGQAIVRAHIHKHTMGQEGPVGQSKELPQHGFILLKLRAGLGQDGGICAQRRRALGAGGGEGAHSLQT